MCDWEITSPPRRRVDVDWDYGGKNYTCKCGGGGDSRLNRHCECVFKSVVRKPLTRTQLLMLSACFFSDLTFSQRAIMVSHKN